MKKVISLLLCTYFIFNLTACGNRKNDDAVGSTDIVEDAEIVYVPEFMELGDAESISWSNMRFVGDDLYYISYNWDMDLKTLLTISLNRYTVPEGTTVKKELSLPEDASIDMWTISEDGSLYAVLCFLEWKEAATPNYTYMLAKYDTQGKELFVSDITDFLNTEGSRKSIEVDGEGRIYISDNTSMWLFDANGEPAGRVGSGTGMGGRVNSFCRGTDGRVYVVITENDGNGNITNLWTVNYEEKELENNCSDFPPADVLYQNAEGNFVLHDGVSVYEYDVRSREAEKLFTWLDCDMNGLYVTGFGEMSDGRITAVFQDWQSHDSGLAVINRISADQVIPKQEIVLGMMFPDLDIEAAVTKFNKRNQDYHVTIRYYVDQNNGSETAVSDALIRLNIDIASDNCPDILNLDRINVKQLADKGVFEDLIPYLEQGSVDRSDLLENIVENYTFDDKLICIPDSFAIRTIVGSRALVGEEMGWTLDEMIALADDHPDAELFDKTYKEGMLEYCLAYNMDNFVDWETGSCNFDTDEFKRLLRFAAQFPDMEDIMYDDTDDENQPSTFERIRNGEVLLCNTVINQLDEIQYYVEMFDGPVTCIGYPNAEGRSESILVPFGTYAITSKSNVKEGAWAFLESYLTRENPLSRPGFPYSRSELEHMAASQSIHITGTYEYRTPTQEEIDIVLELIEITRLGSDNDEQIMNIIGEDAATFFQGQKSVDEVAETIQRRVTVYVSENS